jgi:signal transduction histidine kinase
MISAKHLPNQSPDEKIIQVIRRTEYIVFQKVVMIFFIALLPLIFYYLASDMVITGSTLYILAVLASSAYYLFVLIFALFCFIDYYLDVWIITNERIVDIEQRGYFSRVISEHKIYRIQDVTSEIHGVIPTILKFGDVHIQTAGAKQRFMFHQVPDPNEIRNTIIRLMRESRIKHKEDIKKEDIRFEWV